MCRAGVRSGTGVGPGWARPPHGWLSSERGCNLPVDSPSYAASPRGAFASAHIQQLTQNWYGPGESDCLIKTKHCDGLQKMLTQCDFCPVL